MSTSAKFWAGMGLLLVGVAALLYWGIEWVEKTLDAGPGPEARSNEFYAAELFLEHHGFETETVTGMSLLDALPPTDDLILLSASRESLSERRRDALAQWVREGGSFIVVAHSLYDDELEASDDRLLDELGIFLLAPDEEEEEEDETEETEDAGEDSTIAEDGSPEGEEPDPGDDALPNDATETLPPDETIADTDTGTDTGAADADESQTTTFEEILSQTFGPAACAESEEALTEISTASHGLIHLEMASENELAVYQERVDDAYFSSHSQVLAIDVGEGRVIAMTSIAPFRNRRIHCHDHAFFLAHMAEDARKVWLLHDPDVPSLLDLALREMPATTLGACLLLTLFVASASLRFGIAPNEGAASRRELREHLEAGVAFRFRKGGFASLFARLQADLARSSPEKRDRARWSKRAGVDPDEAQRALQALPPRHRRDILKRVQTMLRMRRTP